jgi:hypothetical protein
VLPFGGYNNIIIAQRLVRKFANTAKKILS